MRLRARLRAWLGRRRCRRGRHELVVAMRHHVGRALAGETRRCVRPGCDYIEARSIPNRASRRAMRKALS